MTVKILLVKITSLLTCESLTVGFDLPDFNNKKKKKKKRKKKKKKKK